MAIAYLDVDGLTNTDLEGIADVVEALLRPKFPEATVSLADSDPDAEDEEEDDFIPPDPDAAPADHEIKPS